MDLSQVSLISRRPRSSPARPEPNDFALLITGQTAAAFLLLHRLIHPPVSIHPELKRTAKYNLAHRGRRAVDPAPPIPAVRFSHLTRASPGEVTEVGGRWWADTKQRRPRGEAVTNNNATTAIIIITTSAKGPPCLPMCNHDDNWSVMGGVGLLALRPSDCS